MLKKCIICGKNNEKGRVTCSHECSRKYKRIIHYIEGVKRCKKIQNEKSINNME